MKHGLCLEVLAWHTRIGLLSHSEGTPLDRPALMQDKCPVSTPQATWTPPQTEPKMLLRQRLDFSLKNFILKQFKTLYSHDEETT